MSEETKYELVKFIDNELELDITISPNEENIWLSKNQIAELFGRERSVISKHIKKIFEDLECDIKSNVQKMHIANSDKIVEFYSLDVSIDPYSETIWLTQSQMAILFGVDISRISRHIKNTLSEKEINSQRNLRKTQITNSDK